MVDNITMTRYNENIKGAAGKRLAC